MEEQYWENREYDFIDLITTQYGFESEMLISTEGIQILSPQS